MMNFIKNFLGLAKTSDQLNFESLIESIILSGNYSIEDNDGYGSVLFKGTLNNKTVEYAQNIQRGNY